jgi:hypothetical protein
MVASVVGVGTLYSGSSQNTIQEILAFLYIIPFGLVGFSMLIPTAFFLVTCEVLETPHLLSKISAPFFWRLVYLIELIGIVLLLIYAVMLYGV